MKNLSKPYIQNIDSKNLNQILEYAHSMGASDIHLIVDSKPAIRVNKILDEIKDSEKITPEISRLLVDQCLSLSKKNKNILEKSSEIDFSFSIGSWGGRYRVNVYKQKGNYSIALREIPLIIPDFDDLGLPVAVKSFASKHKGLVLITGATGSGKTTTLASLINLINEEKKCHIITIEDPIEYIHNHKKSRINQREVGSDTESFSTALRSALREDPDVILVGEMRDPETISIALTAAETGHLVFSTLHTIGAAKTIDRIIDSFPSEQQNQVRSQLATVLNGIVSQELIPKMNCNGLVVASEVMITNSAIRNLIRENKPHQINSIIQTNCEDGMQSMNYDLSQLVREGVISRDDAIRNSMNPQTLINLLDKRW